MKKTIITVCEFVVLFGFVVSSATAQTWTWSDPAKINTGVVYADFQFDPEDNRLEGWNDTTSAWEEVFMDPTAPGISDPDMTIGTIVDSVAVPPFAVIDVDTVGILSGSTYVATSQQPTVPSATGAFKYIAASYDGATASLYVIYQTTGTVEQHVITGTATMEWDSATVRYAPRSLNLGSNGNWVTCKISGLTGHTWDEVDLARLCIVGINDSLIATPICVDTAGPSNTKNEKKMMVKFDRRSLADEISAWIADNPDADPTSTKITVAHSDGTLNFYGEDTIKTKPAKEKKPKKK
jgi:hypothetical protein